MRGDREDGSCEDDASKPRLAGGLGEDGDAPGETGLTESSPFRGLLRRFLSEPKKDLRTPSRLLLLSDMVCHQDWRRGKRGGEGVECSLGALFVLCCAVEKVGCL